MTAKSSACAMTARAPADCAFCALLDRKSTRLNSSHLGISYAVFCLKKKKKWEKDNHLDMKREKRQTKHQKTSKNLSTTEGMIELDRERYTYTTKLNYLDDVKRCAAA